MGYLACPVCERQSLADVSDLQQRVAAALNRPLSCPICSASVGGIQAFHHHLAIHLPVQHKIYSEGAQSTPTPTTPSSLTVPQYPVTSSPESMPTLERLEINDSRSSPLSPSLTSVVHKEVHEVMGESMQSEPQSPSSCKSLSSQNRATQPHNCDLCGLVFSSEHFLKFHKDIIHSKRDFFDVTCKLCKDKFKDFEAYRNHVRESHSDRRYICDQCPKTFKMKGSLLVHTRMFHDPSSPGTCQLCKKTFTTKARKELHEKRYHGVGLEHIPTGKISPPSPSVKQQKTKNSSLGDAKNWLETLMTENKTAGDENSRYKELQEQQLQHQMQHIQQQTASLYPNQLNQNQVQSAQEDQTGPRFASQISHYHQTEQVKQKGPHDLKTQTSQETQQIQKSQQTEPQVQQLQKWDGDIQQYVGTQEKINLAKISPEAYYHQQKLCISLPNHMAQQNYNSTRARIDYSDFKNDKKFSVMSHGESAGCRSVGGNYSQQSPVAIVSPQPQKSETPPSDNQNSEVSSCHTEARRNSFPLINVNKLGISHTETPHIHPPSYIGEISLNASAPIPIPANQGIGIPTSGDKMQSTLAVSQQLIYQHSQNLIPTLNTSMAIMGSDSKIGVRVPPLFIPSSSPMASMEKVKEPPDSPVQMMHVQEESCTSEMMGDDEASEGKPSHELPQEHRLDISHIQRQGSNVSAITRKDSNGKMDAKQWECDVCKKSFTTKYFLKKHKRLHTGETPYACAECGKTFTFQQSYHKHILYHSDDKPHQCSYCGRAFKEMSTLHNHVRIHTGEKPFVCETCGKAFRQRVSYLVHQRIHTGVMPYTCDTCGRSFRYKVSLRSHKCESSVSSPSTTTSVPSGANGRTEVSGTETGQQNSPVPATPTSIILLPSPPVSTATTLVGVVTGTGGTGRNDESAAGVQQQQVQLQPATPPSSSGSSIRETEVPFHNNNRRHQQSQHRQRQHQQHRAVQQQLQEQQADKQRQQEEINSGSGRSKSALETIDLSAISCDGLQVQHEIKKYPSKSNKSPLQCVSPRSSGVTGMPTYHDPLSMAFLHALVDPQQGRLQGECRPHMQVPQDGLPFPSLSPGAMDTDLDHDNFLTNLLM